jgi:hypothetical protein
MNNMNNIEILNKKIIEFLDFLNSTIDNSNINKLKTKIKLGLLYDSDIVYNMFSEYITKYKYDIINNNEMVLYDLQIQMFDNKIKLYELWKNISNENKIIIWKYLKVFLLLVE